MIAAHDAMEHILEAEVLGMLGYIFFKVKTPTEGADDEASNANKLKQFKKA